MSDGPAPETPQRFAIILVPGFSMAAFTCVIEPMRLANRAKGEVLFEWQLYSVDGQPVAASSGIAVAVDGSLEQAKENCIILCGGVDAHRYDDRTVFAWLRRIARLGTTLGAVCTGGHILAKAGLMDGYKCTIHWENLAVFSEDFPDVQVSAQLYAFDRNRFTCAGGTAPLDMMLHLIAQQHGEELCGTVAEYLMHERIRSGDEHQRLSLPVRLGVRNPRLLAIIENMENNLEEPLRRTELASQAGLSTRQLERLFRKYLNRSPARYYLELRLQKARLLLLQSNLSVMNVALACGFVSASHFTKCYRAFFGRTPYRERGSGHPDFQTKRHNPDAREAALPPTMPGH